MDQIPLAEMLIELRAQLEFAQSQGNDKKLRFRAEAIELELQLTVTRSNEAGGGIKFWVINADGKHRQEGEVVQKLRLKLNPVEIGADGKSAPVDVAADG